MADNWQLKAVISANAEGMIKALKTVNAATKDTRKYLSDVAKQAGSLGGKLGLPLAAVSGVLGGFSLAAVKGAVTAFGEMGETIYKGSIRAGMSVEQYQRMKYVAEQAGVGVEMLEGSMGKLNRTVGEVGGGKNKNAADLFKRLGINVRDANGHIKAGVDILPELADAFKRNQDPAVQARMGMALFGKKWQEIAPMLMEGGEGIAASLERMKRFKGVMSDEDINGAREFARSMRDAEFVLKGFQMTIAKNLAPVIKPLIDDFTEWAAANKKVIAADVAKMAKELAAYIKTIDFKAVIQGVGDFFSGLRSLVEMVGGAKNALIALVVFMNIQTIKACADLVLSIGKVGISLVAMTVEATAGAGGLATLTAAMGTAKTMGLGLLGVLGQLAAAAAVGYGIGTLLNEYAVNPLVQKLTGDKDASLGTWLYDKFNDDPMQQMNLQQNKPSLVTAGNQVKASGQIQVSFKDAPPGMRVEQSAAGGNVPIDLDVGYRSYATGMPM